MSVHEEHTPAVNAGRRARRRRSLLATAVAATLAASGISYLSSSGATQAQVGVVPGAAADGSVAEVRALSDAVTTSKGGSKNESGVKFARVDVAAAFATNIRISFAWLNASEFFKKTGTKGWQLRFGLYYPVRTGDCTGSDPNHAVNVTLSASESWNGNQQSFCAYRDLTATGPGTVASGDDRGTQLMAASYLVGGLRPQRGTAGATTCTATGTTPCVPAGLATDRRTWLVVASLLNPGGNAPQGQVSELATVDMFVRARKVGG
ncbi:hypothetical protein ACFP3Q_18345 [Nocardioides sp. GCM10027113]|uniref:hypothetical protein n=1 Tax=unclassified Nocardioides TaxID=2615069 RepID=UPI00360B9444